MFISLIVNRRQGNGLLLFDLSKLKMLIGLWVIYALYGLVVCTCTQMLFALNVLRCNLRVPLNRLEQVILMHRLLHRF